MAEPRVRMAQGTWIDRQVMHRPLTFYYRKAKVLCEDGVVRSAKVGNSNQHGGMLPGIIHLEGITNPVEVWITSEVGGALTCRFKGFYGVGAGTWIEKEEVCTEHEQFRRHFRARCMDGVLRTGTAAIPDTAFSIPARLRVGGGKIKGYLRTNEDEDGTRVLEFVAYDKTMFQA